MGYASKSSSTPRTRKFKPATMDNVIREATVKYGSLDHEVMTLYSADGNLLMEVGGDTEHVSIDKDERRKIFDLAAEGGIISCHNHPGVKIEPDGTHSYGLAVPSGQDVVSATITGLDKGVVATTRQGSPMYYEYTPDQELVRINKELMPLEKKFRDENGNINAYNWQADNAGSMKFIRLENERDQYCREKYGKDNVMVGNYKDYMYELRKDWDKACLSSPTRAKNSLSYWKAGRENMGEKKTVEAYSYLLDEAAHGEANKVAKKYGVGLRRVVMNPESRKKWQKDHLLTPIDDEERERLEKLLGG